jgi:hypothetical protein
MITEDSFHLLGKFQNNTNEHDLVCQVYQQHDWTRQDREEGTEYSKLTVEVPTTLEMLLGHPQVAHHF